TARRIGGSNRRRTSRSECAKTMVPRGRPMGRRWPRSSTDCWQYGRSRAMDRRSDRRGRCRRIAPVRRRGPPIRIGCCIRPTPASSSSTSHREALHAGPIVDASNDTVIPGLIEIHTHLNKEYGEALGRIFLSWGITTVRNPATNAFETMENREAFESGVRIGPRLITTGEPFDGTRIYYPGGSSLDDTGQLPLQLQHAAAFGFDFIKTYVRLPDLMQKRVIEEAHRLGMR